MIEFVTLSNAHNFYGNPLVAQHKLRYQSIIVRQDWDVPCYQELEFDQYDNPAAKYLVYRDNEGIARGVSRFYPTILPYMLEEKFSNFVTNKDIPKQDDVWEGSRFCIDHSLPAAERRKVINEIVAGYLEVGLRFQIKAIVGLMYPAYWRSLFIRSGWDIEYMGETMLLEDGNRARSAWLPISEDVLDKVREVTGVQKNIVDFGVINEIHERKAA